MADAAAERRTSRPGAASPVRDTLVVVPTYDEAESIEEIAGRILAVSTRVDLLVVDDASPDGTGAIVDRIAEDEPRVRVLHRAAKLGLGTAYLAGFADARRGGYRYVFEFDADGSHPAERIPALITALDRGADLAIGSRYVPGGATENWPLRRELLSRCASIYARTLLQSRVHDITAGFRGYRVECLAEYDLDRVTSTGYCFQVEMAWMFERRGKPIVELPITFVERENGVSKMSRAVVFEAIWRILAWGIGYRLGVLGLIAGVARRDRGEGRRQGTGAGEPTESIS